WKVQLHRNIIDLMCTTIDKAVEKARNAPNEPSIAVEPFIQSGQTLFKAVFPTTKNQAVADLHTELRKLQTPLLLSTNDPDVPWELLYDSQAPGFFGLKYPMGRRLLIRDVPLGIPRPNEALRCLLIANPNQGEKDEKGRDLSLPGTEKEEG